MARRTGPTNIELQKLIIALRKKSNADKSELWRSIAEDLSRSTRQRRIVNVSRLNRFTDENETIIVPGKVLGSGFIDHKLTVAAFSFSEGARNLIEKSGGKALRIQDFMKKAPETSKIKIMG